MPDTFYTRLDFYRLLHAGSADLPRLAQTLRVSIRTLKRWKESYDPVRIAGGSLPDSDEGDPPASEGAPSAGAVSGEDGARTADQPEAEIAHFVRHSDRDEILRALRREALDGNVQAAKLLLAEYEGNQSASEEEVLTIEQAAELLREWSKPPVG